MLEPRGAASARQPAVHVNGVSRSSAASIQRQRRRGRAGSRPPVRSIRPELARGELVERGEPARPSGRRAAPAARRRPGGVVEGAGPRASSTAATTRRALPARSSRSSRSATSSGRGRGRARPQQPGRAGHLPAPPVTRRPRAGRRSPHEGHVGVAQRGSRRPGAAYACAVPCACRRLRAGRAGRRGTGSRRVVDERVAERGVTVATLEDGTRG